MSGRGRSGDNRGNRWKSNKRGDRDNSQPQNRNAVKDQPKKADDLFLIGEGKLEIKRGNLVDRHKWIPPKQTPVPQISANCAWCNKPIKDISTAIADPETGKPVHFDCVIDSIIKKERLESGDTVSYIGGGRFGIVHYNNPPDTRDFKIKKIFEWENKENRSEWRLLISNHFAVT